MKVLLHSNVYMPEKLQIRALEIQRQIKTFIYSEHLLNHFNTYNTRNRGHNYIKENIVDIITSLRTYPQRAFEIETDLMGNILSDVITKICVRVPYDDSTDAIIVFKPLYKNNVAFIGKVVVITAWLNHKNDKHNTLDVSKYFRPFK